ncbi:hypothetical protein [Variovorax sp. EL159]|uniref:hypothetical protein n=1 Tax=Variovorax sp. EL159 TaxID=1566270 RepID=UPI000B80AE9A|nr:hypothetical protein [Variovorax sp. EL159]
MINGCVVPESELWRLIFAAIAVGVAGGVVFSTVISKALDLALLVVERRHRIEAARTRDHSQVPSIHG